MASTYDARFPRKIRDDLRAWAEDALARLQAQRRADRIQELSRKLSNSEVGSLLFFMALILATFLF